jgi:lipopolysaccharide export system protein LptA
MCRAKAEFKAAGSVVLMASALLFAGSAFAAAAPKKDAAPAPASDSAAPAKPKQSVSDKMRPSGPITVTATSVDWAKNGLMVYTGDVKLDSDTLLMDGDRLELEQLGDGLYRAKITGNPAHLTHQGTLDDDGQPDPPVTARGKVLNYDSKSGVADVSGDAKVTRGEDEITGESIHYNLNERRIQAAGGTGGQVRIVIQPQGKGAASPPGSTPATAPATKPAPAAAPAMAPKT